MINLKNYLQNFSGPKTLMAIYPHPDDETMAAGGLLKIAHQTGFKTIAVILTRGGAGKTHINLKGLSLKEIREKELRIAAKILNIDELVLGDFMDGKLREEEKRWSPWVREQFEKFSPSIVVTYDPSGMTGHPDHIILSVKIKKVISQLVGKKTKLLWTSFDKPLRLKMINSSVNHLATHPTHQLDLGLVFFWKWLAAKSHRSQNLGKSMSIPLFLTFFLHPQEWYHEVDLKKFYPHKFVEFPI